MNMKAKTWTKWLTMFVLTMLMAVVMSVTAFAEVQSGVSKGTKWSLNTDTGVLTIDVDGPMGSWTRGAQPWYKLRSYVKSIEFAAATSKITNYAFADLVNLQAIEIPNSIEEIGDYAFADCNSAEELYIPISVATWGGYVFENCYSINYIYTENTTNISKTSPIWDSTVGSKAAGGQVELQIESKSIGAYAFYGLSSVTTVKLPSTLTAISDYAFYGFVSPFALDLKSATNIGQYAFYGCTGVTSISLPVATTIGAHAFDGCTGAKSISLPVATTIGEYAFNNCSGAETITVGATSVSYGSHAFAGCKNTKELYLGSIAFTSGSNALNGLGATSGVTVTLGKSISAINGTLQAGYIGTTGAMTLQLEEGSALATIAASAFEGNTMLRNVDFSNRAGAINYGAKAFNNCANLVSFGSNKGAATLTTLSFGNLKKLETLNWNAASTNLGWSSQLQAKVTFTSGATTAAAKSSSTTTTKTGSPAMSYSSASGYGTYTSGYYYYGTMTWAFAKTNNTDTFSYSPTVTQTTTSTTNATYDWVGTNNTGNHPFYNLGQSTTNGATVTLGDTVQTIPDYMLTTGIYAFETKNSSLSRTYAANGTTSYSKAGNQTSGTSATAAIRNNPNTQDVYIYNSGNNNSYGWYKQSANGTINNKTTASGNLIINTTVTGNCAITEGVKLTSSTNIKLKQINSLSKGLTSIGESASGWIQIPITSENNDLPSATVTSSFTVTPSVSATRSSTSASVKATKIGNTQNGINLHYNYNYNAGSWGNHGGISIYRYNASNSWEWSGYAAGLTYYSWPYPSVSNLSSFNNTLLGNSGMGISAIGTYNDSVTVSLQSGTINIPASTTTTRTWSTINNASNVPVNNYPNGNNLKVVNLGMSGNNMTVGAGAFLGAKGMTNAYLASTVKGIAGNVFYTRNTGTGDIIYAYGKSGIGDFTNSTGLSSHNDMTVQYKPALKDLGIFIAEYQVGDQVTAYLYNTSGDEYLVNIAGTGETWHNYTATNRPGWDALYGKKVTEIIVDNTVTSIGDYMFYGHSALEKVTTGTGLTYVGDHAFDGCTTFDEKSIEWTCPVTEFGDGAFANTSTTEASIPSTIKTMGSGIWAGSPVTTVSYRAVSANDVLDNTIPFSGIGGKDKSLEVIIGDGVTNVPAFMFYDCKATKIFVGNSVTSIGNAAFSSCEYLTNINVAAGNTAFRSINTDLYTADGLTLVTYLGSHTDEFFTMPANVPGIAAGAFYGHDYLTQASFDATITNIGKDAFAKAPKLATIAVSDFMDEASFLAEVTVGENWSGDATVIYSGLNWDIGVTKGALMATLYSDGTLAIKGTGDMKNWPSAGAVEWNAKRDSITKVTFEGDCTSIGSYAFSDCRYLVSTTLPDSIKSIGQYAFYNCAKLENLRIPDKVTSLQTYTLANCTSLYWVDCGTGMTTIEPFAFAGDTNVRYISLNGTVKEVKANAFKGDYNLTLLILGKQDVNDFTNHDGVVTDKADMFRICYLQDISNGHLLTRYACNNTTGIYGGYANNTDVWAYAYDTDMDGKTDYLHVAGANAMESTWTGKENAPWNGDRATLTKLCIEDDVTSVGPYAFTDCTNLQFIRMGKGVSVLGTQAFYNCSSLETFLCNARALNTGSLTETSQVFEKAGSENGFTVVFEDDAERIPGYMFFNCENLTNLTLGKKIASINSRAFQGCTGLKTIYMKSDIISSTENNVFVDAGSKSGGFTLEVAANSTRIPDNMFYCPDGNPYITSVFVAAGSKLANIGTGAFQGCNRLSEANFNGCTQLVTIQNQAFQDCTRLVTADFSNCTSLRTINSGAFANCMNLAAFSISNDESLYEIAANAFKGDLAIPEIVLPGSVKVVGSETFGDWTKDQIIYVLDKTDVGGFTTSTSSWCGNATVIYTQLKWDVSVANDGSVWAYYTVPDPAQVNNEYCIFVVGSGDIKDYASQTDINWPGVGGGTNDIRTNVSRIIISDGVTRIGDYAFAGFTKCKELTVGSSVESIGVAAFKDDALIPEADLTASKANLQMIEANAFENCSGLSTVNLSGCDALGSVGNNAFKQMAVSSRIYVSSDYLYDMLANSNGNIRSTYGTTDNTKVVSVKVYFAKDLVSQGVSKNTQVTWQVEVNASDSVEFTWYYATEKGGEWTEITSAMNGYTISSTTSASTLTMDASIVTLDKNGWYFYCQATSPYYTQASAQAALGVYSSAIKPVITVIDKNGDSLESNTWTQGPLTIYITEGTADNGITPTYQYKLKASGTWRNTEPIMKYNTEGIITMYVRAIINNDVNTASEPVKYILKVDNTNPTVSIAANPEFESTESVDLTATANDQTSGVQSISWYKTAADGNDSNTNSGVTGYVPLFPDMDMFTVELNAKHIYGTNSAALTADEYITTWEGKNETHSINLNQDVADANTIANWTAADNAVTSKELTKFELYEVHVSDGTDDYPISASNKGVITLPVPTGYDANEIAVYAFNKAGVLTPISNFSTNNANDAVTFTTATFGQFLVAEKAPQTMGTGSEEGTATTP